MLGGPAARGQGSPAHRLPGPRGVRNILDGAALLAALDGQEGVRQVQVLCTSEAAELLDGCAVQVVDPRRYAQDVPYRDSIVRLLVGFAPELMVNLDPERGVQSDDLVHAALPSGAIAYEHPGTGHDVPMVAKADSAYTRLVPRQAGTDAMLAALGLERTRPALRPSGRAREEAREMLESFGWDPATTLAVLADRSTDPEDPGFQDALAKADRAGWTLLGLGDRDTYSILEPVLGPRGGRAANLAGVLSLGAKAALLQRCGAYLGEAGALQALARRAAAPPSRVASSPLRRPNHARHRHHHPHPRPAPAPRPGRRERRRADLPGFPVGGRE